MENSYCQKSSCRSGCWSNKFLSLFCSGNSNIAVVNLSGIIGKIGRIEQGISIDNAGPLLEKAFATKNLKAVAINVNSPGGSPVQSELIYKRIRELTEEKKVPVYTFAQDLAASGGYFILCAGDEMFAHDASIVGSIGVISAGFGFEDLIKKFGVTRRVYAQGKNKSVLDPFLPEDESSIAILKSAQRDVYESFKAIVRNRRKDRLKGSEEELFNGAFWSGKTAVDIGLIDAVDDMRSVMKKKFGNKLKFVVIEPKKKGLVKELLSSEMDNFSSSLVDDLVAKITEKGIRSKFDF